MIGPGGSPLRLVVQEIRASFYRKLFLAFVAASLVPVLALALRRPRLRRQPAARRRRGRGGAHGARRAARHRGIAGAAAARARGRHRRRSQRRRDGLDQPHHRPGRQPLRRPGAAGHRASATCSPRACCRRARRRRCYRAIALDRLPTLCRPRTASATSPTCSRPRRSAIGGARRDPDRAAGAAAAGNRARDRRARSRACCSARCAVHPARRRRSATGWPSASAIRCSG